MMNYYYSINFILYLFFVTNSKDLKHLNLSYKKYYHFLKIMIISSIDYLSFKTQNSFIIMNNYPIHFLFEIFYLIYVNYQQIHTFFQIYFINPI